MKVENESEEQQIVIEENKEDETVMIQVKSIFS